MEAAVDVLRKGACSTGFRAPAGLSDFAPLRLDSLSAADVDSSLVRVSQLEALARLRLGRAAARFLEIRGNDALGFPRIGDYSSERLGISGRELQSFAFVASRLPALPQLASAFARGEVSWSQTRLLCAVADASSETSWLARARGLTVRDLVEAIRTDRAEIADSDIRGVLEDESDSIEGESPERFSMRCPSRVALAWRRAVELARRMLGSQAPTWRAAESIAAEASSYEVTVRQLRREVEWALDRRDAYGCDSPPPEDGSLLERPDLQTCARSGEEVADRRGRFSARRPPSRSSGRWSPGSPARTSHHGAGSSACYCKRLRNGKRSRAIAIRSSRVMIGVARCRRAAGAGASKIITSCFRSRGGGNEQSNRLAVCASHHLHAVHRYVIRVSGRAPDAVVWELGLRPGRAPFLVLHGERYVSPIAL